MKFILIIFTIFCSALSVQGQTNYALTASESYNGVFAHGTLRVSYVIPGSLRKPLLVVEGFDPGYIVKPEEQFGFTTISTFLSDINDDGNTTLKTVLTDVPQYDVVYLDWSNGTDYIQRNALLVEEAIRWINTQKALAGSAEPNVVLGQSMGGLAARYALRDMENKSQNHQTRLFISDDSPQQGANVPEGFQHLARHARDLYIRSGVTAGIIEAIQIIRNDYSPNRVLSLANEPAARQMLVNYVNDNNAIDNSVHAQWQSDLATMGYPQGVAGIPFRKVAISNGSECAATEPFNSGDNLLTYNGKARSGILSDLGLSGVVLSTAAAVFNQPAFLLGTLPGRNDFNFDFVVNSKATAVSNQVYHGKITYTKKILWLIPVSVTITNRSYNESSSTLPFDYYPGGAYDLSAAGFDLQNASYSTYWLKYNITASNKPSFCFVPVTSALDIGGGAVALSNADYLAKYSGGAPPIAPKNSPFVNFITATNSGNTNNEAHISFKARNGNWLGNELNAANPIASCSFICTGSGLNITGPSTICTSSALYTLNNQPPGTTISWSVNPNLASISASGNQATLTRTGSGYFTLTANVFNTDCGGVNINLASIRAGGFGSGDYPVSGPSSVSCGQFVTFSTVNLPGATNYSWFYPGNWSYQSGQGTNSITLVTNGPNGGFQVGVRVANVCDAGGSPGIKFGSVNGCSSFMVSPNPGNSSVMVSPAQPVGKSVAASQGADGMTTAEVPKIYKIRISDATGNIRKSFDYPAGVNSIKLNVADLANGIYSIQIFDKTNWESQQLIISR